MNQRTMKRGSILLALLLIGHLRADGVDDLLEGNLVDCDAGNVVIFEHTVSRDNHYALAWTIQPRAMRTEPLAPPADWASYSKDRKNEWLAAYDYKWRSAHELGGSISPYKIIEGIIDLRTKKFTEIVGGRNYHPLDESRRRLEVVWSDDHQGTRCALIDCSSRDGSDPNWYSYDVWMVEIDGVEKAKIRSLKASLEEAVVGARRNYLPGNERHNNILFSGIETVAKSKSSRSGDADTMKIGFSDVPSGLADEVLRQGKIVVSLPEGTIKDVIVNPAK